jgi:membrane-bound lytic murein transglycosylase B
MSHRRALPALGFAVAMLAACAAPGPSAPQPSAALAPGSAPIVLAAAKPPRTVPVPLQKSDADTAFFDFLRTFRSTAIAAGASGATYDAATANIQRNARVEQLNETQPEFVRPVWEYLSGAVSDLRVSRGRMRIADNAATLADVEMKYGVPREVVTAIWGIESDYGADAGRFNLFEALATLAYDGPRQDYGRREFIAGLKLADAEHLDPTMMQGSWAGAIGQTQFVPSTYLLHAVDGDGDGKRDLWNSAADALASTASYLKESGWKAGEPWGQEVKLPDNFPYDQADTDIKKKISDWQAMGVRNITGGDLAADATDGAKPAAIFLPAGARGPAFLLRANFDVILKYNNATSYALAVGLLSDRLKGGDGVIGTWPRDELPLSTMDAMQLQEGLTALGFNTGGVDGLLGPRSRIAVRAFQKMHGFPADGFATKALLDLVNADRTAKGV